MEHGAAINAGLPGSDTIATARHHQGPPVVRPDGRPG